MGTIGDTFWPALTGSLGQAGPKAIEGMVQGEQLARQLALLDLQQQGQRLTNQQALQQLTQPKTPKFHNLGAGAFAIVDPLTGQPTQIERPPERPHQFPPMTAEPGKQIFNPTTGQFSQVPGDVKPLGNPTDRVLSKVMEQGEQALTPGERAIWKMYQQKANEGKIPQGYRQTLHGTLEAVPGGPADLKQQGMLTMDTSMLQNSTAGMDRLELAANELLQHPGLPGITGLRGAIPNIPGTAASDAQAKLENLKSQVGFSVLQEMRNNSKSGGALGQVSDKENIMLQNNLAALQNAQSLPQFQEGLQKLIAYARGAKERLQNAYNMKHGGQQASSIGMPGPPTEQPKRAAVRIRGEMDYAKLPSGAVFIDPEGKTRRKP